MDNTNSTSQDALAFRKEVLDALKDIKGKVDELGNKLGDVKLEIAVFKETHIGLERRVAALELEHNKKHAALEEQIAALEAKYQMQSTELANWKGKAQIIGIMATGFISVLVTVVGGLILWKIKG